MCLVFQMARDPEYLGHWDVTMRIRRHLKMGSRLSRSNQGEPFRTVCGQGLVRHPLIAPQCTTIYRIC